MKEAFTELPAIDNNRPIISKTLLSVTARLYTRSGPRRKEHWSSLWTAGAPSRVSVKFFTSVTTYKVPNEEGIYRQWRPQSVYCGCTNGWMARYCNLDNCHHFGLGQLIVCSRVPCVDRALVKGLRIGSHCRLLRDGRAECDVSSWVVDDSGSSCSSHRLCLWDVDGGDVGRREPGRDPGEESIPEPGLEGLGLVVKLVIGPVDGHVGLIGARCLVVPPLSALARLVDQVIGTVHDEEGNLELRGKGVCRRSSLQDLAGEPGAQVAVVHQGIGLVSRVEGLVVRELVQLGRVPVVHLGRRRLQALALQLRCHGLGLGGEAGREQDQAADHEVAKVWAHGGVDGDERAHAVAEDEAGHSCRCGARLGNVADEV
jgi:hypothetical protein